MGSLGDQQILGLASLISVEVPHLVLLYSAHARVHSCPMSSYCACTPIHKRLGQFPLHGAQPLLQRACELIAEIFSPYNHLKLVSVLGKYLIAFSAPFVVCYDPEGPRRNLHSFCSFFVLHWSLLGRDYGLVHTNLI